MVNELSTIKSFWSIFDELICIDGQPIQKPEMGYNEAIFKTFLSLAILMLSTINYIY